MERYEYLNGPPAPRMVAELAMRHDVLVKQLADAQATIEALQARVEALEGWQDGVVTAFREAPLEWSPDLGQGNIPSALPQIFKNMHDYATKLTQRTAELEAAKAEAGVICPTGAADNYTPMLITDNGPTSATEAW